MNDDFYRGQLELQERNDAKRRHERNGHAGKAKPAKRVRDRWSMFNAFVDCHMQSLGDATGRTWVVLFRESKPGKGARISHNSIAKAIGRSRSTAIRATQELIDLGYAKITKQGKRETLEPNTYAVLLPDPT